MTIELPVFQLSLAGFTDEQYESVAAFLRRRPGGVVVWQPGVLEGSDAWWIHGAKAKMVGDDCIRVPAGVPSARALQLHLPDVDRPVAYSRPFSCPDLRPAYSFDLTSDASMDAVLDRFEAWFAPVSAQFSLAANLVEHQSALGAGTFELRLKGQLLAVVNLRGEIAVLAGTSPANFEDAQWHRQTEPVKIPENFVRSGLSELMWQYAIRTRRDVLPPHYRAGALYFRRPPRVPQRQLKDTHLLLMRELVASPATFDSLLRRSGLPADQLAHDLAALYFVGSITSNPRRAANPPRVSAQPERSQGGPHSNLPSGLDSVGSEPAHHLADLTAPAPLRLE